MSELLLKIRKLLSTLGWSLLAFIFLCYAGDTRPVPIAVGTKRTFAFQEMLLNPFTDYWSLLPLLLLLPEVPREAEKKKGLFL